MNLSLNDARAYVAKLFVNAKVSKVNAAFVANALVAAEADGLKGHGLSRLPTYLAQALSGKVDGFAKPKAKWLTPSMLCVDAASGFAYPAIHLAEKRIAKAVSKRGIVMVGIANSHHAGVCGHVVERLAEQGFVSLMFANTPSAIAPWGGSKGVFGTNPIAFATPVLNGRPVVVDMALSKVARGPIVAAAQKGVAIPEGWALDDAGNPTTDAKAALKGTMLPLGDSKGTALAFMVEVLAAGLTGGNFAAHAPSFLEAKGNPPHTGQLLIVIDPNRFQQGYAAHLQTLINDITEQQGTRLSGYRRYALRAKAESDGVTLTPATLKEIEALGIIIPLNK